MKEAYYFSHDSNASQDEKILNLRADLGWEGYGLYWAIVERLRDSTGYKYKLDSIKGLAVSLGTKSDIVCQIVNDYDLFEKDDSHFWSVSLLRRMKEKEKRQKQAKDAINKRWGKPNGNNTDVIPEKYGSNTNVSNQNNGNDTAVIQGKERKGNIEKKLKESKVFSKEEEEELREIFLKNDLNPSDNDLKNFIALNSGGGADFTKKSLESRAVLFMNNPKRSKNGNTNRIQGRKIGITEALKEWSI